MKHYQKMIDELDKMGNKGNVNHIVIIEGRDRESPYPDDDFLVSDDEVAR